MPNGVKYSTTTPTGSFKRGNVILGVNANLGPTSTTGFYSMPVPQTGKYIINKVSVSGIPNFFAPQNDAELIRLAKAEGATGADTGSASSVLAWIAAQDNLEAVNFEYESIITDGLVLNLDAGFVASYPTTGTTTYDLSGNAYSGTLTNGPTYDSSNSGSIVFDGSDDYINGPFSLPFASTNFTCESWVKPSVYSGERCVFGKVGAGGTRKNIHWRLVGNGNNASLIRWGFYSSDIDTSTYCVPFNTWSQIVFSFFYDGNNNVGKIYVNGSEQSTTLPFGNPLGPYLGLDSDTNYFGTWTPNLQPFLGLMSIFRVYNRVLSATEILQNYNAQKGRFGL